MAKQAKGSDFERDICRALSKWWTNGARDDIYWRSSQSGGRATQRSKKGLTTFGSYGDLTAVDPIGWPLLELFTIELKRGSSYGTLADLFDTRETDSQRPFEACLEQAIRSYEQAGSIGWLLITRRDNRIPVVYFDPAPFTVLEDWKFLVFRCPSMAFKVYINSGGGEKTPLKVMCQPLDVFLQRVTPAQIKECLRLCKKRRNTD